MSELTKKSDTHEERFIHLALNHDRFHHATLFARKENKNWWYTIAFCVKGDIFCKKIGRSVARRKYFTPRPGKKPMLIFFDKFSYKKAVFLIQKHLPNKK